MLQITPTVNASEILKQVQGDLVTTQPIESRIMLKSQESHN